MQDELCKMRAIVDARPNKSNPRTRINNLLTGYCTVDHTELEYMQLMSRVFYYRKHCSIFQNLKKYNATYFNESIGNVVGVFKSDQYIIKYDNYTDLRQLAAYKKLGFGINRTAATATATATVPDTVCANIITPIWYCIYARNDEVNNGGDDVGDNNLSESADSAIPANDGDKPKISIDELMTLEVQPKLHNSMSFQKWYNTEHILNRDHDYVITTIMLGVAKSIQFCHSKNIVHGDIKPDNFIVECGTPPQPPTPPQPQPQHASENNNVIRRSNVPTVFLIDFGLCGTHDTDDGTGGTRPFCAPETTNVNNFPRFPGAVIATSSTSTGKPATVVAASENDYVWCKLSKSHDVWSLGLMLFTIISYNTIYHYYKHYPSRVFDRRGYVRDEVLTGDRKIREHPLYPVFMKTLCPPDKRAPIDEIINLMTDALVKM